MAGYRQYFGKKRITLMGLGLLGRGVGDAAFLAECGAKVIVTDIKDKTQLAESVKRLSHFSNITFHLGGHQLKDFTETDLVIKAAGVPLGSQEIAAARGAGVPVAMSTALFAKFAQEMGAQLIGVTGTRGKTTVTSMIYHCVRRAGRRVHIGGNVRGKSTLALLPDVQTGDIVVLELDSWQLQGFGDLKISPHIAVVTNLMPDHQNYYPNMDTYFEDKANIFRYQQADDFLFVEKRILERVKAARPSAAPHVPPPIPHEWTLGAIGQHNRDNAALAAAALRPLGMAESDIRSGLESFKPVEGRLQLVRELGNSKIYNDNNATTPEATIAGLKALGANVTLIAGGSEKGLELGELVAEIKRAVSHLIVLTHPNYKGSERFKSELQKQGVAFEEATSLSAAVKSAVEKATNGPILFSPGFASFGMFNNEYERNDEFLTLVRELRV